MGQALAKDCIMHNINVLLAPGVNIKRHILCGRNFEYFSEDPVLSGEMAAGYINGLQSLGVKACIKHFALNNQECERSTISVEVDERTMREIYLKPFQIAIEKANPASVMCAFNKVNGIWCSENKGTIMGAVLASSGLGGAIAIQLVGGYIDPEVVGSYRDAYRFIAIVLACCAVLLLVLFRDKPKTLRELPKTSKKAKKRGKDWTGIDFNTALKKPYFWGIVTCIFFSGLILQGINGVNAMHMKDVGIDYDRVKELLSFGALVLAGAKFFTGFLYDKGGLRVTASLLTFFGIVSPIILGLVTNNAMGIPLAVTYSITAHLAMPLETVILPIYAADLFGKKDYAKILGIFVSANTAGYAVGSPLLNLFYDTLGSYVPGLFGVGAIMSIMLIILQFTISLAHKDSKKIIEAELKRKTLRYK
jgi:MFS family permease